MGPPGSIDPPSVAARINRLLEAGATLDRLLAAIAEIAETSAGSEQREHQVVAAVDRLADGVPEPSVAAVARHVFDLHGFAGDVARYYDPSNSLIHRVLERRRGIPITLAAVVAEVGRRHGVALALVGMPGHVLLTDAVEAGAAEVEPTYAVGPDSEVRWYDPFDRGRALDYDGCRQLFARFHPIEAFQPVMLRPMDHRGFVIRNLNNLRVAYTRLGDVPSMVPVLATAADLTGAGPAERFELANILEQLGRSEQAAVEFDRLAEVVPEQAGALRAKAALQRARRN